jgi:hypothetical protein
MRIKLSESWKKKSSDGRHELVYTSANDIDDAEYKGFAIIALYSEGSPGPVWQRNASPLLQPECVIFDKDHLVEIYFPSDSADPAVTFYHHETPVRTYTLKDLVKDREYLKALNGSYDAAARSMLQRWCTLFEATATGEEVMLETMDGCKYTFLIQSGEKVSDVKMQ